MVAGYLPPPYIILWKCEAHQCIGAAITHSQMCIIQFLFATATSNGSRGRLMSHIKFASSQLLGTATLNSSLLIRLLLLIAACCFPLAGAQADFVGSDLVMVTMSDTQGRSASAGIPNPYVNLPDQVPDHVEEMINERFAIQDGDDVLGWVDWLAADLDGDPVASIGFNVTAGGSNVTVGVSSATVAFSPLNNPPASAEAEVTLTDNGNDGAAIDVVGGETGLFKAIYNNSQEYVSLLGSSSVMGGEVDIFQEDANGPIAGSVSSIQAQFNFELSAGDSARGTGRFVVVPEPSTVVMLLGSCLAWGSMRRRT